jgi:hypothetical protein
MMRSLEAPRRRERWGAVAAGGEISGGMCEEVMLPGRVAAQTLSACHVGRRGTPEGRAGAPGRGPRRQRP